MDVMGTTQICRERDDCSLPGVNQHFGGWLSPGAVDFAFAGGDVTAWGHPGAFPRFGWGP